MLLALIPGNVVQLQSWVEIKCSGCELYPNLWDALFPGVAISICFSWASIKTNKQTMKDPSTSVNVTKSHESHQLSKSSKFRIYFINAGQLVTFRAALQLGCNELKITMYTLLFFSGFDSVLKRTSPVLLF